MLVDVLGELAVLELELVEDDELMDMVELLVLLDVLSRLHRQTSFACMSHHSGQEKHSRAD